MFTTLKLRYCEKATKIEKKISHFILRLLSIFKRSGSFFKKFAAFSENLNFNTAVPKQRDTTTFFVTFLLQISLYCCPTHFRYTFYCPDKKIMYLTTFFYKLRLNFIFYTCLEPKKLPLESQAFKS